MSWIAKLFAIPGVFVGLDQANLDPDPVRQFLRWYRLACRARCPLPDSFLLATVSLEGRPSARMMLLKDANERGFVFYSHYVGRKAREMERTPFAALVFHWVELARQVRIEGPVEKIGPEESDAYFRRRARGSRIGAWASRQSEPLESRAELDREVRRRTDEFRGRDVPRPSHWGGYRVWPEVFEFWQGRPNRLHDRFRYTRSSDAAWQVVRLQP